MLKCYSGTLTLIFFCALGSNLDENIYSLLTKKEKKKKKKKLIDSDRGYEFMLFGVQLDLVV